MAVYTESYGSVCCPKDPKWGQELLVDYVGRFNQQHGTEVKEIYEQMRGREGERIFVLTLAELNAKQQEEFIMERTKDRSVTEKQDALHLLHSPKLVTDFIKTDNVQQFRVK